MTDQATQGNDISVPETFDSPSSAADFLAGVWEKEKKSADGADTATADEELPVEGDTGPEEVPGETQEADPEETLPPVEPPRSWTKEAKDRWNTIPREAQEEFARIEQGREREFLRSQQEAAEKLKGLTAKEQQADEARQKSEAEASRYMQKLVDQNNQQFSDIKGWEDLQTLSREAMRLSATDPIAAGQIQAYIQAWNVHQQEMADTKAKVDQANARKQDETRKEAVARKTREHSLLIEKAPEFADQKKLDAAQKAAVEMFREKGFGDDDLMKIGDDPIFDDHRMQLIVNDALKFRALEAAKATVAAKAAPKTLPPVQRPGISRPAGAGNSERIQALEAKLNNSGSEADAFALLMARRASRAS